jgi:hypothetical protein
MVYVDEEITYLYVIDWRQTSMRRTSYNLMCFDSPTSSVVIPEGYKEAASPDNMRDDAVSHSLLFQPKQKRAREYFVNAR